MTQSPETAVSAPFRTADGGRIDRSRTLAFTFNGEELTGHPGDTLASALLANGRHAITTSIKIGRPRGISAAWAEDPCGLVQIEHPFPDPMLLATTVELFDGLVGHGVPGQGRLSTEPDPARYDSVHHHVDVLVVGAGPAGLTAALTAARAGARVALVDEQSEAGGSLLGTTEEIDGAPALQWVAAAVAELATYPEALHLQRTTAFGAYDDGFVLAVERRTDHLGGVGAEGVSRQRVWRLRAASIVVATGAHERPVIFADDDRPGILLAGSARTYLHRWGVLPGRTAVVFTTNDTAYDAAIDLHRAGVTITALIDARPEGSRRQAELTDLGIDVRNGATVVGTRGTVRITDVVLDSGEEIATDTLLVSGGWNPAVHLFSQRRGKLAYDDALGAFLPGEELDGLRVAGTAAGAFTLAGSLLGGHQAALAALADAGVATDSVAAAEGLVPATAAVEAPTAPVVLWRSSTTDPKLATTEFVDLQRDATVHDIATAIGAGLTSIEHIKRYTTIGTAHDQGKTSGIITSGIVAGMLGMPVGDTGTTTFRPPYTPVSFATLAGRDRGRLFDPERVTAVHDWHVAAGAVFEDVGMWKRPRHYPRPTADGGAEDMETAVLRECAAVRTGVGMLDGSTLGKIDVQGEDAGQFLDLIYTNMMSTLKVGMVRYGVMCGADGMVIDDGTVLRLADDRFLVLTTTGGAARILDWMEEWLQTEWPHLKVWLASATEQYATFPVVGPKSRQLIADVFADVDVSNEVFPFMAIRHTTLDGVPVMLGRISFSGELAFEVYVSPWYALSVWERLIAAGQRYGITPYGTETMHVLRAEKGYPIIGQDTDGTVSPHDLGLGWAVSKKKVDFIGKRSFSRPANQDPTRKQLVGLLPIDRTTLLPEGSQIVDFCIDGELPPPPVPMLGHVTSSYRSAELERPFALALVKGGQARIGETLHVPVNGALIPVEVTGSVLVDPEGARRDG
ncbi:FAD-dependent oxidoreductase [Nakamurella flava]|uniref:Sarcosine oxidase subunit alpha n=1 Tax=Nakamurella flava TaxID=2576308 RepID=A0A4U6QAC7_9ACTN|nr:2Fe-2S iron-sulfur cluster-binding protein [Nakamurella flava]TKV56871.1 FAD-dependent oxidoreductase [Nakamurella flava]